MNRQHSTARNEETEGKVLVPLMKKVGGSNQLWPTPYVYTQERN